MKMDFVFRKISGLIKPGMKSCDIGLGNGYSLQKMYDLGMEVSGIDISNYAVKYLRDQFNEEHKKVSLYAGDVTDINVDPNNYDLVTCFDVLEHVPDLDAAVRNIEKMLTNGGLLVATVPFQENLEESHVVCPNCCHKFHRYGHHHSFHSINELRVFLTPGFEIIETGLVPYCWFNTQLLNTIGTWLFRMIKNRAQSNTRSILYFVARVNKT